MESANEFILRKSKERLGKTFSVKDISRNGKHKWKIEAITFMPESTCDKKVLVVERLSYIGKLGNIPQNHPEGHEGYRFGYWIVGRRGNKTERWVWGQFSPYISIEDFNMLLDRAEMEGTIIKKATHRL